MHSDVGSIQNVGRIHSGALSQAKRDTMQAEKGHFAYKFVKKWEGDVPPVLSRSYVHGHVIF